MQRRHGVAWDHNGIISLNLPTAVQSPRSKGDGRYDAGDDVLGEYVLDTVSWDDSSARVLTDVVIVDDASTEVPDVLADGGRCFYISKNIRNIN